MQLSQQVVYAVWCFKIGFDLQMLQVVRNEPNFVDLITDKEVFEAHVYFYLLKMGKFIAKDRGEFLLDAGVCQDALL